jgi:hypothetical protein
MKNSCVSFFARSVVVLAFLPLVAGSLFGACASSEPVTSGVAGSGPVSCGGSGGTSELATWENLREVVNGSNPYRQTGCFGSDCQTQGDREPYLVALGGTAMSDSDLYAKLTTYKTTTCGGRVLVKPCSPDESAFYLAQAGRCEDLAQMPFGCLPENDNCTPADMLEGIRQWIANGAHQN